MGIDAAIAAQRRRQIALGHLEVIEIELHPDVLALNGRADIERLLLCPYQVAWDISGIDGFDEQEVLDFKDPAAGRVGPIALQMHNAGLFDEYKDISIELDPREDKLVTTE